MSSQYNLSFLVLNLLFLVFPLLLHGQDKTEKKYLSRSNEIKSNLGMAFSGYPEFSYERILNEKSALSLSFGFIIDEKNLDEFIEYNFNITPAYRFYLGKKPSGGFFFEANMSLYSEDAEVTEFGENKEINKLGFGAGSAVGVKLLSNKAIIVEVFSGVGKNFLNTDFIESYYLRLGVVLGKRF